jgi:hypothetical protein
MNPSKVQRNRQKGRACSKPKAQRCGPQENRSTDGRGFGWDTENKAKGATIDVA